jgi:hypothetical protein
VAARAVKGVRQIVQARANGARIKPAFYLAHLFDLGGHIAGQRPQWRHWPALLSA